MDISNIRYSVYRWIRIFTLFQFCNIENAGKYNISKLKKKRKESDLKKAEGEKLD